ncbi:DUF397 domain-containing protein [Actinomadura decatromicini]|uniref:DUF397 domain-containing protein n=1 Tax=Actinomadura decatromicini TaxID=2604572 RepID=A0A5D3F6I2_9ACTN|nr:DUF397 domain-containing protein [Actinomadura decatromicini]TYK43554.1 DUF397 domain-containing protein [Actinomadura decatromicini]
MTTRYTPWRDSRHNEPNGSCVQMGLAKDGTIGVRGTKVNGTGPTPELTRAEWASFIHSVQASREDVPDR